MSDDDIFFHLPLMINAHQLKKAYIKGSIVAYPGDWVIKKDDDSFTIMRNDEFKRMYRPCISSRCKYCKNENRKNRACKPNRDCNFKWKDNI